VNLPHLEVSLVKQYGREEYRPENDTAKRFVELLGQKVLTVSDIDVIKRIGFKIYLKGGEL
jgi:hypothetical protein